MLTEAGIYVIEAVERVEPLRPPFAVSRAPPTTRLPMLRFTHVHRLVDFRSMQTCLYGERVWCIQSDDAL